MRPVLLYIITFLFSFLLLSCDAESDSLYLDETTEDYQLYDYYVDEDGNEGIVAYIYNSSNSNRHYILVISSDEAYLPWGPLDLLVYPCDSSHYSVFNQPEFPIAVLQSMKSIGIERFPAQQWCDKKNKSHQYPYAGSWHLPSLRELQNIFSIEGNHLPYINHSLYYSGGTLIDKDDFLWTCLEDYDGYITIDNLESDYDKKNRSVITTSHNSTLSNKDNWIKKNHHHVRAVKYIYFQGS